MINEIGTKFQFHAILLDITSFHTTHNSLTKARTQVSR